MHNYESKPNGVNVMSRWASMVHIIRERERGLNRSHELLEIAYVFGSFPRAGVVDHGVRGYNWGAFKVLGEL